MSAPFDLKAEQARHAAGHGPTPCARPDECPSARYLAVIERLLAARRVLRLVAACRLRSGNGTICRDCWTAAEQYSRD